MVRSNCQFAFVVFLASFGCAVRQPWRLVSQGAGVILVPPDVRQPDLRERKLTVDVGSRAGRCAVAGDAVSIRVRSGHARLTVIRGSLESKPPGWLLAWTTQLEEDGCLAIGEGLRLAEKIAESVPLEPGLGLHLLYSKEWETGETGIDSHTRIQVVSPLWQQAGLGLMAEGPYKITGHDRSLTVTGKSTDNLLGYETTIYATRPEASVGYTIVPVYSDRHLEGKTERKAKPTVNYFQFSPNSGFYRFFYKSWKDNFTAMLIGASSPAELNNRMRTLEASGESASCGTLNDGQCVEFPKDVGITSLISVRVNGREVLVRRGVTVFNAIRASGEPEPTHVLSNLKVYKPWNGRVVAVAFDGRDAEILKLVLSGGEVIAWP